MIYVISSSNRTGGPELLHQFVHRINKIRSGSAKIYYTDTNIAENFEYFSQYITKNDITYEIEDRPENVIVVPETFTAHLRRFSHARKVVWWLSVDNYFLNYGQSRESWLGQTAMWLRRIKRRYYYRDNALNYEEIKRVNHHWFQSYYAKETLYQVLGIEGMMLSDYISETIIPSNNDLENAPERDNVVLYNPKKGLSYTKEVIQHFIKRYPSNRVVFIPLVGLSKQDMKELFLKSKLYMDFGYHPGKDRIPREACVNGCVIITNKKGSAKNALDIPIDLTYKIDFKDKSEFWIVSNLINDIMENFDSHTNAFFAYRNMITAEKNRFDADVERIVSILDLGE